MFSQILKRSLALCSALTMALLACNISQAGVLLSYSTSPNPILQGGSGSIDVSLTNEDLVNVSQNILSFDFELTATAASGITFTSVDFPFPLSSYIYGGAGESLAIVTASPLQVGSSGLSFIGGSDLWALAPGAGRILAAGETVLLATIQFSVAPNATPGDHSLLFTKTDIFALDLNTQLEVGVSDLRILERDIAIEQSINAIPEPASVLVFLTLTGLVAVKRRRATKQA